MNWDLTIQAWMARTSDDCLDLAQVSKRFAKGEDEWVSESLLRQSNAFLAIPLLEDYKAKWAYCFALEIFSFEGSYSKVI